MRPTPSPANITILSISPVVVTFGTVPAKRWIFFSCFENKISQSQAMHVYVDIVKVMSKTYSYNAMYC